jgi:hypothetical protein
MVAGNVPPAGYEQPEYSGLAPGTNGPQAQAQAQAQAPAPEPMLAPQPPPSATGGATVNPAELDNRIDTGQIPRPLWPSKWPATSGGGAYHSESEVYTADQVKRLSGDEPAAGEPGGPGQAADPGQAAELGQTAEGGDQGAAEQADEANTRFW